jgi:uncharacterized membrane protein
VYFTRFEWLWAQVRRQLIYRAIFIGLLAVAAALLGLLTDHLVPQQVALSVGAEAVDSILTIIASSMLAVTTFSLSTVVAAYGSATSTATPRATNLLLDDTVTQNMLATFIGAFIYSIVAIVLLKAGVYGTSGRLVLFGVTIFVIGLVVMMLVRWIDFLMHFGRLGNVLDRIERAAHRNLVSMRKQPCLGGMAYDGDPARKPPGTSEVLSEKAGYVQFIDMEALSELAGESGEITVAASPGKFVYRGARLAYVKAGADEDAEKIVRDAFVINARRTFDQDPRLALITLSEVASRALSPAVNDPGTAIEVLARHVRVFTAWAEAGELEEPLHRNVRVAPVGLDDMFDDAFLALGRDGASHVEVVIRMMKSLAALAETSPDEFGAPAQRHMALLFDRAVHMMPSADDRALLVTVSEAAGLKLTAAQRKRARTG